MAEDNFFAYSDEEKPEQNYFNPAIEPRFVEASVPGRKREGPGFGGGLGAGLEAAISGVAETGEAAIRRWRGQPIAEPTEVTEPRPAEIAPSEAVKHPIEQGLPWLGYMVGR